MYLYFKNLVKQKIIDSIIPPISIESILNLLNELEVTIKKEEYNCIVDGANVAFHNTSDSFSLQNIIIIDKYLKFNNMRPLVILHSNHFRKFKYSYKRLSFFKTPKYFDDDLFWLYCSLSLNCKLVTNDKMRDHEMNIFNKDEMVFKIWKKMNVCRFKIFKFQKEEEMLSICTKINILSLVHFSKFKYRKPTIINSTYVYNKCNRNIIEEINLQANKKIKKIKCKKNEYLDELTKTEKEYFANKFIIEKHFNSKITNLAVDLVKITSEHLANNIFNSCVSKFEKFERGISLKSVTKDLVNEVIETCLCKVKKVTCGNWELPSDIEVIVFNPNRIN